MWEDVSGAVAHPFIMALLSSTSGSDSSQCTALVHCTLHLTITISNTRDYHPQAQIIITVEQMYTHSSPFPTASFCATAAAK